MADRSLFEDGFHAGKNESEEPAPLRTPPVSGHTRTFGQMTEQELFHSSAEEYQSAVKEEFGRFIIRQVLYQSQDGAAFLLKTVAA